MEALTAPQAAWPSTMSTRVPSTATPYSILEMISEVAMLPATRLTNTCPMLWSNMSSTGTRESAQERTDAKGSCFSAVFCCKIEVLFVECQAAFDEPLIALHQHLQSRIWTERALSLRLPRYRKLDSCAGQNTRRSAGN